MVLYQYRCAQDGCFDVFRPLGTAPEVIECEACGGTATRVFTPPMLPHPRQDVVSAIEHAEKSAHEPEVVTSLPTTGRRKVQPMAPLTPSLMRLPRP